MQHQRIIPSFLTLGVVFILTAACSRRPQITQNELVSRTQKLYDAASSGDQTPWKKYLADDAMYFDEKGRNMDKTALVNDVTPLPRGYSGSLKLVNPQSHIEKDIAILSYDLDEKETVFGQNMTARYHDTDTWMFRRGEWQIVAGQAFRYYEDPAPGKAERVSYPQYAGTYQLAPDVKLVISLEDGMLYRQRGDQPKDQLHQEAPEIFFRKGVEGRLLFRRGQDGKVDAVIDRRNNEDIVWARVP